MTLQKKIIWGFGLFGALAVIGALSSDNSTTGTVTNTSNTVVQVVNTISNVDTVVNTTPAPTKTEPAAQVAPNGYYENTYGNEVPRPYVAPSIPAGASAQCADGTYSFSQSRRGTCSHHGGVATWY